MEPTRELLTPGAVRRLLHDHGLAPRRSAGQNFVTDPNTVRKIVHDARVGAGDVVLEIGPGLGSLTLALAEVVRRVVAVEIDAGLSQALREVVAGRSNVEVVHADALRVDLDAILGEPAKLVANLPYNVATPLVLRVLGCRAVDELFVMVQREVGARWAAGPGDPLYSGVSVKLRDLADVELVATVPPTVFHPVPKVDSVTVRVTRRPDPPGADDHAALVTVVDAAFGQRRKTVRNSLRPLLDEAAIGAAGVDPGARPQDLALEDFRRLAGQVAR